MDSYIVMCKKLSLTARLAIALLIFERFCTDNQVKASCIDAFLDYLWQYPLIQYPDQFTPWESARPELVNFGLGDTLPAELIPVLANAEIEESRFQDICNAIVEILWGSFWGAAEDELSYNALNTVIVKTHVSQLPSLTPFKFSLFQDNDGWGERLTEEDRDFWRNCV